jgi:2-amino-4-hydroxy-6-hydroxymethyldihydropteridine diphosphokinase
MAGLKAGSPSPVAVALGSNLGDRARCLHDAAQAIRAFVPDVRLSTFHDTAAVGGRGDEPRFLNAAAVGSTTLDPHTLLARLLDIEQRFGRERPYPNAPRTLDLDLILYGSEVIDSPRLTVPHPRFRERRFVLAPLAEIAPDWTDPVTGLTILQLLQAVEP